MHEHINYQNEIGEPTKFGEALTIVGEPFGRPVDNEELLKMALEFGLPPSETESARRAIETTGFTRRFFSHSPENHPDMNQAVRRTVGIGAKLLLETMKAHGWADGIDVFIDTSAFLPTTINKRILETAGLSGGSIFSKSYRYACAGAMGAFIDCLTDPTFKDARIVIGAIEPLSLIIDRSHFLSTKNITVPAIFGDANTFMAFTPRSFDLNVKKVLIKPDGGVIKMKTLYDFASSNSDPASIPDYYHFEGEGKQIFHNSKEGALLNLESPPEGSPLTMDGGRTGLFFGDETTKVIIDLLTENGDPNLLNKLNGKNIVMHSASKPVVDRIAKLLWRRKYLDVAKLPFLMDAAGHSNGSSATTLNRWRYMIQNNLMDSNLSVLWIAPGIGSAIAGAIGTIRP